LFKKSALLQFVKFPLAILFKFFPKIFIVYFFGRVIWRQQLHDTIASESREGQADEKVVEDVDRMTTKTKPQLSKDDSKCTVCHCYLWFSIILFKLKSNLALQVHLQVPSLRLLTEFPPHFLWCFTVNWAEYAWWIINRNEEQRPAKQKQRRSKDTVM
jgi:hypothetical protein